MENRIRNSFLYSFLTDDAHIGEMILINAKSLVDDSEKKLVGIDDKRLECELLYYRYYAEAARRDIYGLAPLVPIFASNKNKSACRDEAIRNINVTSSSAFEFKYENMISAMLCSSLYHGILERPGIEMEILSERLKAEAASFCMEAASQADRVKIEKARIYALQKIDRLSRGDIEGLGQKNPIDALLRVIYQIFVQDYDEKDAELASLKKSLLGAAGAKIEADPACLKDGKWKFIEEMADYMLRLRDFSVRRRLFQQSCDPRSLIALKKGEEAVDPIMGRIRVKNAVMSEDILNIEVESKSGIRVFRFKKKQGSS